MHIKNNRQEILSQNSCIVFLTPFFFFPLYPFQLQRFKSDSHGLARWKSAINEWEELLFSLSNLLLILPFAA